MKASTLSSSSSSSSSNKPAKRIEVLDATLREQAFGVSFSLGEKLVIADDLDSLGVSFVESLAPGDNPAEAEYLKQVRSVLKRSTEPVLFCEDARASISSVVPDFVKYLGVRVNCWQSHLSEGFSHKRVEPEENLKILRGTLSAVKTSGKSALVYAQHFFDGFFEDTTYALSVLEAAAASGVASRLILCDSRGSTLPDQISKAVKLVANHFSSSESDDRGLVIGIHAHNDLGLAVANSLAALQSGARHVQGTVNGIGERSGVADLCELLPILILKLGYDALNSPILREQQLLRLKALSERVSIASGLENRQRPFVGDLAFAHSDPFHIAAVNSNPETYEPLNPAQVGNSRQLGVDDASLVLNEMWELGLYSKEREGVAKKVLARMRELEAFGCKFDESRASLHLLILETLGFAIWPFQVTRWETTSSRALNRVAEVSGTVEVLIGGHDGTKDEKTVRATEKGVGPIHAIDLALRKGLESEFPELKQLKLTSYSLNIVDSLNGTAAACRARAEFSDQEVAYTGTFPSTKWATTAVSEDVLDASIKALIDGYRYKLIFRSKKERYALPDWKVALGWRYSEGC